ncbi:hypothetical protein J9174_09960 [Macrococcoides canis]|uniref:hypothetical protein n=1 Tax=Macrococcoides canis TaxID=1855823 RepID=UPI001AEC5F3A|nr:hypothetical protein [Macrococcus canis]QTQ07709.1 hypothetical protein J9174_09960 [Macrococcus canis]
MRWRTYSLLFGQNGAMAHVQPAVWAEWCDGARTAYYLGRMVRSRTYSQLFGQNGAMAHVQPTIWAK